jgi:membrane-bound lytic murein transglycosylase F
VFQTPEDLADKLVVVRKGTSYEDRLTELQSKEIPLQIRTIPDIPTEELIRRVAEKKIDITIADSNIAMLNRRYYPQAVLAAPITKKEYLGWAVHKKSVKLKNRINDFFWKATENGTFSNIFDRYYKEVETFDYVDLARFHRRLKSRLPAYRDIIQTAADKHGFDWRLIAAMAYQESHFNPRAKSDARAYGLMQLTRRTAESLGVDNIFDPRENVEAGVQHLKNLYDFYDKAEGEDRLFIALAAYNIGRGHILDARNLARRRGLNPDKWPSLEQTLPLLEYRRYYKNTEYGYCRGRQPIEYLERINIYYDILKQKEITTAAPGG